MKKKKQIFIIFIITLLFSVNFSIAEVKDSEIKTDNPDETIKGYTPDSEMNPDLPKNPGKKWEVKGTPKPDNKNSPSK